MKTDAPHILAYCLKITINDNETITDHFEIFCEIGELGESPLKLAKEALDELKSLFENDGIVELYTWNIAEIVTSSEHYL